jgi:cellulose synthase/poly-beta-1,6-N-acetylglucosamine synthase-like glycosyltransferase
MPWAEAAVPVETLWLLVLGLPALVPALARILILPLAAWFEIRAWFGARAAGRHRNGPAGLWAQWPTVSIIVAAHNAEAVIGACVRSVQASRYERYELILVNAGSTDDTAGLLAGFAAGDGRIVVATQPHAGEGNALNAGIRRAKGEILMFLAPDAEVGRSTVDRMLQGFEDESTGAVRGSERTAAAGPLRVLDRVAQLGRGCTRRAQSVTGGLPTMSGGMTAVRRTVIAEAGPFRDAGADADLELGWRVRQAGYRIVYAPRAVVRTAPRGLAASWARHVRRERSLLQALWIHKSAVGDLRRRALGDSLMATLLAAVILPALRTLALPALAGLLLLGGCPVGADGWVLLGAGAVTASMGIAAFELLVSGSWRNLRHVWVFPLLPPYAVYAGAAVLAALVLELHAVSWRPNRSARAAAGAVRNRTAVTGQGRFTPTAGRVAGRG